MHLTKKSAAKKPDKQKPGARLYPNHIASLHTIPEMSLEPHSNRGIIEGYMRDTTTTRKIFAIVFDNGVLFFTPYYGNEIALGLLSKEYTPLLSRSTFTKDFALIYPFTAYYANVLHYAFPDKDIITVRTYDFEDKEVTEDKFIVAILKGESPKLFSLTVDMNRIHLVGVEIYDNDQIEFTFSTLKGLKKILCTIPSESMDMYNVSRSINKTLEGVLS